MWYTLIGWRPALGTTRQPEHRADVILNMKMTVRSAALYDAWRFVSRASSPGVWAVLPSHAANYAIHRASLQLDEISVGSF